MPALLLILTLVAAPPGEGRVIEDPRGFRFTLPAGFEPFPGFQPTATKDGAGKLYAFGRGLGSPDAVIVAIDVLSGPTAPGAASQSCKALMNSIDRTVGTPITEQWQGADLSGLRLLMTHLFGEVLVFCVDVPLLPNALSVMVSGKPANQALLQETFRAILASLGTSSPDGALPWAPVLAVVATVVAVWLIRKRRRPPPP